MKKQKIYVRGVPCAICLKPVEEYPKEYQKSRTIRSWMYVCNKCWREIEKSIKNQEERIGKLEKEILGTDKMAKQRWYVITYQDKKNPEEVIGFRQALAFGRKEDAEKKYKDSGYKKPVRKIRIIYF